MFDHLLATLRLELQPDRGPADLDVGLQQRHRAPRARQSSVARAAGTNPGRINQCNRGRHRELPCRLSRRKHAGDMSADARQSFEKANEVAGLAPLTHLQPIRMIAVLPPARGIAAHCLEKRQFVAGIDDIDVGRRHGEACQPRDHARVPDPSAVLAVIAEAAPAHPAANGQGIGGPGAASGHARDNAGWPRWFRRGSCYSTRWSVSEPERPRYRPSTTRVMVS